MAVVKDSGFLSLGVLKYVVFYVCIVARRVVGRRCSCMESMSISSCRCCMIVSCVHPLAVLNAAF